MRNRNAIIAPSTQKVSSRLRIQDVSFDRIAEVRNVKG